MTMMVEPALLIEPQTNIARKIYTQEEFEVLAESEIKYELVEGELVEMSGTGEPHSEVCVNLSTYLNLYVKQHKLGRVYEAGLRYRTVEASPNRPATIRMPDVSFVQANRVVPGVGSYPYAPDLAIEVISEGNGFGEIEAKIREYFRAGTHLVWVIEPEAQVAHIYRLGSKIRQTVELAEELDGEKVVPGFKLELGKLFE